MPNNQPDNHPTERPTTGVQTPESQIANVAGRRKFSRLSLGVPVLLTLSSRSVLAGQCLSNMLSGNLSDPDRDSICGFGWSPGGWSGVGGKISDLSTIGAWEKIGFVYGIKTDCPASDNNRGKSKTGNSACYTGGSTVGNLRSVVGLSALIKDSSIPDSLSLKDLLGQEGGNYNPTRHYITAYFNALLSVNYNVPSGKYVMTPQQVIDLANGVWSPPNGQGITDFLDSTWK